MVRPSRRDRMMHNIVSQHRKKSKEIKEEEEKPKDPEAIKNIIELWKKSQEKKK